MSAPPKLLPPRAIASPPLPWPGPIGNYFSTELVNAVSTLAGVLIFTRLVRPEVYGAYAVTIAAASVAMALSGEWLQTATLRLVAGQRRISHRRIYVRALLQLTLASTAVLTVAAAVAFGVAHTSLGRELVVAGWLYAALNILFLGATIYLQATFQSARFALYRSVYSVLRVVLAAALALIIAPSPLWLVGGSIVALLVVLPHAAVRVFREDGPPEIPERIAAARTHVLRFGAPLIGWYAASQILNLSDRFFLQGFLGSAEVGMYSVTYSLVVGATTTLLQPILASTYPAMVRAWQHHGPMAAGRELTSAVRSYLLVSPLVFCGLTLFGNDVLSLLAPSGYQTPRALLAILAAALLCWNAGLYLQKGLELSLRSSALVTSLSIAAAVNVTANLFLIGRFGLIGAAVSTLLGYVVYTAQVWYRSLTALPFEFPFRTAAVVLTAGLVFTGLGLFLNGLPALKTPVERLLLAAPVATLGYAGVLYALGEARLRGDAPTQVPAPGP
jgi:O-antigen/teichoic acid export membrane protein